MMFSGFKADYEATSSRCSSASPAGDSLSYYHSPADSSSVDSPVSEQVMEGEGSTGTVMHASESYRFCTCKGTPPLLDQMKPLQNSSETPTRQSQEVLEPSERRQVLELRSELTRLHQTAKECQDATHKHTYPGRRDSALNDSFYKNV